MTVETTTIPEEELIKQFEDFIPNESHIPEIQAVFQLIDAMYYERKMKKLVKLLQLAKVNKRMYEDVELIKIDSALKKISAYVDKCEKFPFKRRMMLIRSIYADTQKLLQSLS